MRLEGEVAFWLGDTSRAIRLLSTEDLKFTRHELLLGQAYEREQNVVEARAAYKRVVESTDLSIELVWARPIAQARLAAMAGSRSCMSRTVNAGAWAGAFPRP
jgi:hypothetical protein